MHLLTREAVAVYGRALQPDGILLVHISNRYLDLEPVIAAGAKADGWEAMLHQYVATDRERAENATDSTWIALSRSPRSIARLVALSGAKGNWLGLVDRPGFAGWTDDYATILPLLKDWAQ